MAVKKDKIESFNLYGSRLQTKLNNIGQYGLHWIIRTKLNKTDKTDKIVQTDRRKNIDKEVKLKVQNYLFLRK